MKEYTKDNDNDIDNDKNDNDKYQFLLKKSKNDPKIYRKTFPLGYQDKRKRKFYNTRKSKNSKNSSGSSESIEEKNEEFEEDNLDYINNKNNSNDSDYKNTDFLTNDNLNQNSLNEDSDSEIVEEEIISEETIAQIYKNEEKLMEKNNQELNLNNNIITPISEGIIVKEEETENEEQKENTKIILKDKEKKEKVIKKKENILFKYFNHKSLIQKLRIITFITLVIYILLVVFSIFVYIYNSNKKTIFCFEFLDKEINGKNNNKFFLSHRNAFFIIHSLIFIGFISVINTLIKNEYLQLKQFFKEMSLFFPLTLALNMPIFIIGIIFDEYEDENGPKLWIPIFFSVCTLLALYMMGNVLINAKRHKYKSISSLININILCSFLAAYECYCFIYCICLLIKTYFIEIEKNNDELMSGPEIIAGILYFGIGFFIITAFKDIYFSTIVVIVEIGLLYIRKDYSITVVCFNIITTFVSFASIIITIFKYKKRVFGLAHID